MERKKLLEIYNRSYTKEDFFTENVEFAFSNEQLKQAMQKLGAKDEKEITTLGFGSVCLKTKVKEIVKWINEKDKRKKDWLRSLTKEEQEIIIEYELKNHECLYSNEIDNVVELFEDVFEWNDIMWVFWKMKKKEGV